MKLQKSIFNSFNILLIIFIILVGMNIFMVDAHSGCIEVVGTGTSMQPTIHGKDDNYQGDVLTIDENYYDDESLKVGDIVMLNEEYSRGPELLIKRVVAVEGDTISSNENGKLFINGKPTKTATVINQGESYTLKENECYVLGDNLESSTDSRIYGIVEQGMVSGKIIAVNGETPESFDGYYE